MSGLPGLSIVHGIFYDADGSVSYLNLVLAFSAFVYVLNSYLDARQLKVCLRSLAIVAKITSSLSSGHSPLLVPVLIHGLALLDSMLSVPI